MYMYTRGSYIAHNEGLLGIGGGMVLGPLLVALGCDPSSTAATSAFAVLLTATAGLAQVNVIPLFSAFILLVNLFFSVFFFC